MGAEHVFELARHLTERDREVALCLFDQQLLTTGQLALLFFSSRRRAQDRLLFLYRNRVVDRFYPPSRFGSGKPQAHWLLDEAGAILVAATLGVERKRLGWERRDDWASHPQLAHRLETNRFVTDLIAATLPDPSVGVTAWYSSRGAAVRLDTDRVRPDTCFILDTPTGAAECFLEWDRGTETLERLEAKLDGYRNTERLLDDEPRSIIFVLPGRRRLDGLREAFAHVREAEQERLRRDRWATRYEHSWPILATTAPELRSEGPLGRVWQRLDRDEQRTTLLTLPSRPDLGRANLRAALGRRWRHDQPGFWERLSPLGTPPPERREDGGVASDGDLSPQPADAQARSVETPSEVASSWLVEERRRIEEEIERDIETARDRRRPGLGEDLRLSGVDGSMPDPEEEEGSWL